MPTLIVLVLLVTCRLVCKSAEEHHVLSYIEKKVGLVPAMLQQWPSQPSNHIPTACFVLSSFFLTSKI